MNIFRVDGRPDFAAYALGDVHVRKMLLESCQLLSTAHRVLDGEVIEAFSKNGRKIKRYRLPDARDYTIYQASHTNHPCAVWTRESVENYNWLVAHAFALAEEYEMRFSKKHKCAGEVLYALASPPLNLKKWEPTPAPSVMPDEYKISGDPLTNYRQYYKMGKTAQHKWTRRQPPAWLPEAGEKWLKELEEQQ